MSGVNAKICPMSPTNRRCWEAQCGWWDKYNDCCSILVISDELRSLNDIIEKENK